MNGEQHLAAMLKADGRLYEQCLDTPVFAYHFNQLARLACDRKVSAEVELRRIGNELALWLPAPIGDDVRKQLYKLAKQVESFSIASPTEGANEGGAQ